MTKQTREESEALSSRLLRCPLCFNADVQLNTHPELKPDANCNNCGISYRGDSVEDVIEHWNATLTKMRGEA